MQTLRDADVLGTLVFCKASSCSITMDGAAAAHSSISCERISR